MNCSMDSTCPRVPDYPYLCLINKKPHKGRHQHSGGFPAEVLPEEGESGDRGVFGNGHPV